MNKEQIEAFNKFKKLKVGALFMQMGTGKTRVAIELVDFNNCDLLIYVAPYSTLKNIEKEFIKWELKTKYILVAYETIQSSGFKYMELINLTKDKKCFIIADESIFIKNENTKRFMRLLDIRNRCEYALILNGTPISKNEWDLYNQMFFLSPKIINMSKQEFLNTFFTHIKYKKIGKKEKDFYKFSKVNAELLYKMIEPYMFKCDLDFKQEEKTQFIYVDYFGNDYYLEKENKLKEYIEYGNSEIIINMLTSLNVISSNYESKNNIVVEYIKNKQVIVFCNFIKEVEYISSLIDCYVIVGKTKNRNEIIEKFKNDNKPLIMTYGVGSYSLNLQFCDEIVFSSLNFDFSKIEQSKFRIKRLGQDKDIKYTYILTNLGINKMILNNLNKKTTLGNLVKEKLMKGDIKWVKDI